MSAENRSTRLTPQEREVAEQRLQDAVEQGVIELDEFEDRIGVVLAARTHDELVPALADLPALAGEPPRRVVATFNNETLDLRPILERRPLVEVSASALFGDILILVPHGTEVELSGRAVFGERKINVVRPPGTTGPVLRLEANAVAGNVKVRSLAPHEDPKGSRGRRLAQRVGATAAVLGLLVFGGRAIAAVDLDGVSVFGSSVRHVQPGDPDVTTLTLFGSTEIVVPDGARVEPNGIALFGSTDCTACELPATTGGDAVVVRGLTLFGSTEILTESQALEEG